MSMRSGPNSHRHRSRDAQEDFPPLPIPRLPSLRNLAFAQNRDRERDRERDRDRQRDRNGSDRTAQSTVPSRRPPTRNWSSAAARRIERIRSLEPRATGLDDVERDRPADLAWMSPSRAFDRIRHTASRTPSDLHELRTLDEANSQLRVLLDLTTNTSLAAPLMPPVYSPPARPHDFPDEGRRSKRRKLDSERLGSSTKTLRYGKYGQVEAGQLQMEIVSCDGGMFSNESIYAAENILRNDFSVYCTKGNRCNLVLRHQGGTVFTLKELVIKAPGPMNYSHPVRAGMVFVCMKQDETLSRTAQYQIQYNPGSKEQPFYGQSDDDRHHMERDPRHVISIRHHEDGTTSTRSRRSLLYRTEDDDADYRPAHMPEEFSSNVPDFRVTTECSEEEDAYEMPRTFRRAPNRIGSLPFETPDSDSDDHNPFGSEDIADEISRRHYSGISLREAWEAHASATQDAVRAVGGELLTPHARFYIEEKKSKCTIRFDPPVSGRFILLKMWSSHHDPSSNIDIQSVIARGFAGPRYFPSVELI